MGKVCLDDVFAFKKIPKVSDSKVGFVFAAAIKQSANACLVQKIIAIYKNNVLAMSLFYAEVSGVGKASVFFMNDMDS